MYLCDGEYLINSESTKNCSIIIINNNNNNWTVCAGACYTWCCDRTLVQLRASAMQNLTVPQVFVFPVSISVERSKWIRIWWCETGEFQELDQWLFNGLAARSLFVSYCFHFLFFHSMGWCCRAGVFGLIGCALLSPSLALPAGLNNNNNNH